MARVTFQTISKETGLSKFTVSRALAGKSGVSEATRAHVVEVANRLGYKKPTASLKLLSMIFDDTDTINSELHMQIQAGVQKEAALLGYNVQAHSTHDPKELEALAKESDGLLVIGTHSKKGLEGAYATGKPIIRNGWLSPLDAVDLVGGTDHESGSAVGEYLIGHGHRTIAYVNGDQRYRGRMERLYGLREVVEDDPDVTLNVITWNEGHSFSEEFEKLKNQGKEPTAYFCAHDGLAVTVMSELLARGYHIPGDVSVIGFGDYSAAMQIQPQMTTVRVPGIDFGRMMVRFVDERIRDDGFPQIPVRIQIPFRIIERNSSGPAPNA